jgi:hypothetical protein
MKSKSTLFTLLIVLCMTATSFGQDYNSAVGLRLGFPTSVTYKKFLNDKNAIEIYAGLRSYAFYSSVNVNAAYLIHNPIESVDGLSWYYGAGAGIYISSFDLGFNYGDSGKLGIGLSGYLGLDYAFKGTPINLSVDWVPTFFLSGYNNGFGAESGSLAARYILNR